MVKIRIEHLSLKYSDDKESLRDINLEITDNAITVLFGRCEELPLVGRVLKKYPANGLIPSGGGQFPDRILIPLRSTRTIQI